MSIHVNAAHQWAAKSPTFADAVFKYWSALTENTKADKSIMRIGLSSGLQNCNSYAVYWSALTENKVNSRNDACVIMSSELTSSITYIGPIRDHQEESIVTSPLPSNLLIWSVPSPIIMLPCIVSREDPAVSEARL